MNLKSIFSKISISKTFTNYLETIKRFPLTSFASLLSTFLLIYLTWSTDSNDTPNIKLSNFSIFSLLAISFSLSIELYNETKKTQKWIVFIFAILFISFLIYKLNNIDTILFENKQFTIEFFTLAAVFHLSIAVLPYIFNSNILSFWQYNKTLFIGILTAFLYSITLSLGLNLAILGVQTLFDIEIGHRPYLYTFIIVNVFFNNAFFLSRIPKLEELENENSYPIGLKVFTQYVLLPLVAIYTLILLAYEIKIGISLSLPKGWVSTMVLASAVFGILAFLLLNPIKSANKWVQNFTKLFYWLLLPLVVLMFVAIYFRINQYGLTEFRYFVALLTIWLLGISLYFSFSKVDNIKYIPLSLLLILLFGIYAPFNAFQSSRINQLGRLKEVIEQEKLLVNGKIVIPKTKKFDKVTEDKLLASLEYLLENQSETLKTYLSKELYTKIEKEDSYNKFYTLQNGLGISPGNATFINNQLYFYLEDSISIPISGFEYFQNIENRGTDYYEFKVDADAFKFKIEDNKALIIINSDEKVIIDLKGLLDLSVEKNSLDKLSFESNSKNWRIKLVAENGNVNDDKIYLNKSYLLLSIK